MKKTLTLFCVLFLSVAAHGQIVVQGRVIDVVGSPMIGAIVTEEGTSNGAVVDVDGRYSISVSGPGATLSVGMLGYTTAESTVQAAGRLDFTLRGDDHYIDEVVVTALNISKQKKSLGYSVQEVGGETLTVSRDANPMSGLAGKVAGMRVAIPTDLNSNTEFLVRGVKPIVVVDGVPVQTDSWNVSPDDIESISVLKGPTAAALYGSQGMNGAVQITTKRGSTGKENYTVEINSTTQFQAGFIAIPKVQSSYGTGSGFRHDYGDGPMGGLNSSGPDSGGWGPRLEGQLIKQWDSPMAADGTRTPTPFVSRGGADNLKRFLETGIISANNVAVSNRTESGDFRISLSDTYQKGILPNAKLNSANANFSGTIKMGKKWSIGGTLNYNNTTSPNYPQLPWSPQSPVYAVLVNMGPDIDVRDLKDYWAPGMEGIQQRNWTWVSTQLNNPYFEAYENLRGHDRDDVHGQVNLNWKITPDLDVLIRTNVSTYRLTQDERFPVSQHNYWDRDFEEQSGYKQEYWHYMEFSNDLLVNYAKQITPSLGIKASVGGSYLTQDNSYTYIGTKGGLVVPGIYTFENSKEDPRARSNSWRREVGSVYGYVDLDYKSVLFLGFTGRMDKSSTLPFGNNAYFYPSVSLSGVLSDMMDMSSVFSFLRVRASYARVGSDLEPYRLNNTYLTGTQWNGKLPMHSESQLYDPQIEPEFSSSFEVGADMRFFKNRLGFDITYFYALDGPQIFALNTPASSGYRTRLVNGLTTTRQGIELIVNAKPVQGKRFKWDFSGNMATTRRRLKEVYEGTDVYTIMNTPGRDNVANQPRIEVGERLDQIWSAQDFVRSSDGQIVYNEQTGLPLSEAVKTFQGHFDPDFTWGLASTFSLDNWSLGIGLNGSVGGKIRNGLIDRMMGSGVAPATDNEWRRADWEAFKNDPDGYGKTYKGTFVGEGVIVTGGELKRDSDGNVLSDTRTFAPNTTPVIYSDWVGRYYNRQLGTNIQDRTWMKLREVTLTYNLPAALLKKTDFISKASISFVGRNLYYFSRADYVDVEQFTDFISQLQTPTPRNYGFNINIVF